MARVFLYRLLSLVTDIHRFCNGRTSLKFSIQINDIISKIYHSSKYKHYNHYTTQYHQKQTVLDCQLLSVDLYV